MIGYGQFHNIADRNRNFYACRDCLGYLWNHEILTLNLSPTEANRNQALFRGPL